METGNDMNTGKPPRQKHFTIFSLLVYVGAWGLFFAIPVLYRIQFPFEPFDPLRFFINSFLELYFSVAPGLLFGLTVGFILGRKWAAAAAVAVTILWNSIWIFVLSHGVR